MIMHEDVRSDGRTGQATAGIALTWPGGGHRANRPHMSNRLQRYPLSGTPDRPTNSGKTVYGIEREALALVKSYGTDAWGENLARYVSAKRSFFSRETRRPPARGASRGGASVVVPPGKRVFLSPGKHGALTADVCNKLAAEFVPGGVLLYVGDTAHKFAHHDKASLKKLGISLDAHGKVPDVILHDVRNGRLFLVEAVTSHGPDL